MAGNTEKRDVIITLQGGQALHTIKDMQVHMRKLRSEFRKTSDETKRSKIANEMKKVNTELSKQYALTRSTQGGWKKLNATIMKMGGMLAGVMGFQVITDQIGSLIKRSAQLSDQMADVQKTTGLTEQQVRDLDKSLKQIDTRSSRKELLQLARDAGKLGKDSVADVRKFVEEADQINVALGEDLGDGALVTIGKLSNIFKTSMVKIASSINTVGASSEASEPALVEFLSRLGGIANTAKLSAPDIIGYGATLDALGLKAEMSTTALNTFFIDFIKNSEEFGKVAGFAEGELSKLIGDQGTNAGFVAFLERLRETHPEQKQFLEALEDMGITGARSSQVFLTLANNTDMLRKQQDIANDSFEKGTSVLDEFNTKNNNFAANLNRIQKAIGRTFMSSGLVKGIEGLVNGVASYMKVPVAEKLRREQREMHQLVTAIKGTSENQEIRNQLIGELIKNYPKYFSHLDKEKTTNEQLQTALNEVNALYKERIRLAVMQEELTAVEEKSVELERQRRDLITDQAYAVELSILKKENASRLAARGYDQEKTSLEELRDMIIDIYGITEDDNRTTTVIQRGIIDQMNQILALEQQQVEVEKEYQNLLLETEAQKSKAKDKEALAPSGNYNNPDVRPGSGADEIKELTKAEKKRLEELADKTKELTEQLVNLRIEAIEDVEQRSITAAAAEYQREKQKIEDSKVNEELKGELLAQLYRNFENEKDGIHAEAVKKRIEEEKRQVEIANNSELLTLQLRVDVAEEGSMDELEALISQLWKQAEIEFQTMELTNEQKLLIEEDYEKRVAAIRDKYREEKNLKDDEQAQLELDRAQDTLSTIGDFFSQLFDLIDQGYQNQIDADNKRRDNAISNLEKEYQEGKLSKTQYEAKKHQINEKYDKKEREMKRKSFETQKAAQIINAIISAAQAAIAAYSSAAAIPIAGIALGPAMAAAAAAFGAVQVGMIAAQPNPYYKGGRTSVTDTEGNQYMANAVGTFAGGGAFNTASYGIVGEKGSEFVIPNWLFTNPDYSNTMAELEAAVSRGQSLRTSSTSTGSAQQQGGQSTTITNQSSAQNDTRLLDAVEKQNVLLENLSKNGIKSKAIWEWDEFYTGIIDQETIDGRNYFSRNGNRTPGTE